MFKIVFSLLFLMLFCSVTAFSQERRNAGSKTLVIYFSKTGNTRTLAENIHAQVGGDLFQITTVKRYPDEYRATTEVAKVEQENNERPELAAYVENMDSYDTIFVGFPNWWGSMPMALYTFLEHYDLSGKTIVPFLTHGGGGVQRCEADMRKVCSNSTVLSALVVSGSRSRNSQEEVKAWLHRLNVVN